MARLREIVDQYDEMLRLLRADPREENIKISAVRMYEVLDSLDRASQSIFGEEARRFFDSLDAVFRKQKLAQTLLLVLCFFSVAY